MDRDVGDRELRSLSCDCRCYKEHITSSMIYLLHDLHLSHLQITFPTNALPGSALSTNTLNPKIQQHYPHLPHPQNQPYPQLHDHPDDPLSIPNATLCTLHAHVFTFSCSRELTSTSSGLRCHASSHPHPHLDTEPSALPKLPLHHLRAHWYYIQTRSKVGKCNLVTRV